MKPRIEIFRTYKDDCTIGEGIAVCQGKPPFEFKTLELPWKDNIRRISCIPVGKYRTIKHTSPKFKQSFWLRNVDGRSEILIHAGNFTRQILGCILPGDSHTDIDVDGTPDVTNSRVTIKKLYEILPNEFETIIH
jgi:hypothetical protein